MDGDKWDVYVVNEVRDWIESLDEATHARVAAAIDLLAVHGPGLGRPLVDTIRGSTMANLKELRPGTVRVLFAFDPWRSTILLSPARRPAGGTPGTTRQSRSQSNATRHI